MNDMHCQSGIGILASKFTENLGLVDVNAKIVSVLQKICSEVKGIDQSTFTNWFLIVNN